jgi:lipopolysaccharide biosynthesis glycosyltransferase
MLIPAAFVALSVRSSLADAGFDIIVFTSPGDADPRYRSWIESHGVGLREDLDVLPLGNIALSKGRVPRLSLARLLIPEALAGRYDVVLYLDADLTIHGNVAPLLGLDTGEFALAAAPAARIWAGWTERARERDYAHFKALGMSEPFRFFNTGVMLIDVAKWNRSEIGSRTLDFVRRNPALCYLPDEHGLNAVLDGRIAELSPLWNMRTKAWAHRQIRAAVDPVIIHYDGPEKPWLRFGRGKRFFQHRQAHRLYERFIADSPFPDWLEKRWTVRGLRTSLSAERDLWFGWLKGGETPMERTRQRRAYAEAYCRFCAEHPFADIEQGISTRDGGHLRLA